MRIAVAVAASGRFHYDGRLRGEMEMAAMAFDPFGEEQSRPRPRTHTIGEDLATLSISEIDERIAALEEEIARLEAARARKADTRSAADAFFKPASGNAVR